MLLKKGLVEVSGNRCVTRKITLAACNYKLGLQDVLFLGNLDAKRDWMNARDTVQGMWLMLQHRIADDYVLATGKSYSVRQFIEKAFKLIDVDIIWRGSGSEEQGIDSITGKVLIEVDPHLYRPAEVPILQGNYDKAKKVLGWEPTISFDDLIKEMVEYDIKVNSHDCYKTQTNNIETIRATH